MDRNTRAVDGDLFEVGTAMTIQLSVQVGEQTALEQRVIGKVNTADDVAGLELDIVSDEAIGKKKEDIP